MFNRFSSTGSTHHIKSITNNNDLHSTIIRFVHGLFLLFMTNLKKVKEKEKCFSCVLWSSHDEKCDGGTCMQEERTDKKPTVCISTTSNIKKNGD